MPTTRRARSPANERAARGAGVVCYARAMVAFLIHYAGHVQGVGFRYSVKQIAAGFEVTGTVRNLPDGRVELRVQGLTEEIEAFLQAIRESGLRHYIHEETRAPVERDPTLAGFVIAH